MFKRLAKKREREDEDEASGMKEIKEILGLGGEDEISGESDSESDDNDDDDSSDEEEDDEEAATGDEDEDEGELDFLAPLASAMDVIRVVGHSATQDLLATPPELIKGFL